MQSIEEERNMSCATAISSRMIARIGASALISLVLIPNVPQVHAQAVIDFTSYHEKNAPKVGAPAEIIAEVVPGTSGLVQASSHGGAVYPPPPPVLPLELHVEWATVSGMEKSQPIVTLEIRIRNIGTTNYELPISIEPERVPLLPIHKGRRSLAFRGKFIVPGTGRVSPFSAALSYGAETAGGSLLTLFPGDSVVVRLKTDVIGNLLAWSTAGTTEVDVQASLQEARTANVDNPSDTRQIGEPMPAELFSKNLLRLQLKP